MDPASLICMNICIFTCCRYWLTDLQTKVADECVQLHGGAGIKR